MPVLKTGRTETIKLFLIRNVLNMVLLKASDDVYITLNIS